MALENVTASRFINLKGNHYLYQQFAPGEHQVIRSVLLKLNRITSGYDPVIRKYVEKDNVNGFTNITRVHHLPEGRERHRNIWLSNGKYSVVQIKEPNVKLSLYRNPLDPNLQLREFDACGKFSELSAFARKHFSKMLKGAKEGIVNANLNCVNWGKIIEFIKAIK